MFEQQRFRKLKKIKFLSRYNVYFGQYLLSLAFEYFTFVFYLAPYYEYVASCLSNSASLRVKYGFANGD